MTAGDEVLSVGRCGSDVPDVTTLPLAEVILRKDSALDHAVRRLLEDLKSPGEIISGWNSFVE
jgi:FXSXX-COOH protein